MEERLDQLSTSYEFALRRLRAFDDDAPLLTEGVMNDLAALNEEDTPEGDIPGAKVAYNRAFTVCRVVLTGYSFHVVGDIDYDEEDALEATYRFINGPLRETAHELNPDSDRTADETTVTSLRDSTRDLQTFLVDVGCLPPKERHYVDAMKATF